MHWGENAECVTNKGGKTGPSDRKLGSSSWFFFFKADRSQYSKSNWESSSYSLDFVGNDYRVLLTNLVSSFGSVVIRTVVLIRVTVKSAEQIPTAAVKTWNRGRTVSNQWQTPWTVHFQEQWRQKIITEDDVIRLLWHSTSSIPFRRASYTRTYFNGSTKELLLLGKLKSITSEQILILSVSPFWLFAALLSSDTGKGWSAFAFCCGLDVKMAEKHKTCCVMALLWPHCIGTLSQEPRAKSLCGPFCLINHHIYFHRFIYLFLSVPFHTCKANLLAAHKAAILLGFWGLWGFEVLTASSGGMGGRGCGLTQHWKHTRKIHELSYYPTHHYIKK